MLKSVIAAGITLIVFSNPATADDAAVKAKAADFAKSQMAQWTTDPTIVGAINAANKERASYDQGKIDELDKQWRSEVGAASHPLVDSIVSSAASTKLKEWCTSSKGLVTEMILMDAKGLNVGVCDPTSDYWQGDEAKWQKTFKAGPDAVFVDNVEQDESTQRFQLQTSITVVDPQTKQPIGALTVGLDAETLTSQ